MTEQQVYRISILCPDLSVAELVCDFFIDLGYGSGFRRMDDTLENWDKFYADIFSHTPPDNTDLTARLDTIRSVWGDVFEISITRISDTDWISKNQQDSKPIVIGDFFIYQSLYQGDIPVDKIPIFMRADQAFGTGSHYTTAGCLQAIQDTHIDSPHILDVGTGTGILAVGASKYFGVPALACDIDEKSVSIAQDLGDKNTVNIKVVQADGLDNNEIRKSAPYDILIANILFQPLMDFASDFVDILSPDGNIILSGFTTEQDEHIIQQYHRLGCRLLQKYVHNDWVTLRLQKS